MGSDSAVSEAAAGCGKPSSLRQPEQQRLELLIPKQHTSELLQLLREPTPRWAGVQSRA